MMKKIFFILSFIFIIIGCEGGNGSNSIEFTKITKSNFKNVIKAYNDFKILTLINILWYGRYITLNTTQGEHSCKDGGNYSIKDISSDKKKIVFKNCKLDNDENTNGILYITKNSNTLEFNNIKDNFTSIDITLNGTMQFKTSGSNINEINTNFSTIDLMYKDKGYALHAKNLKYQANLQNNTYKRNLDGLISSSDTKWLKITTIKTLKTNSNDVCPHEGNVKIKGMNNYINLLFTSTFNVDIYFNGSSNILHSYNSCKDLPKTFIIK